MKLKIALCILVSLPLFSIEWPQFESSAALVVMPNTLAIVSILTNNTGIQNCFCNTDRSIQVAETIAGLVVTRQQLVDYLHTLTQDTHPVKPDPACYAKAAALVEFAQSRV